MSAYTILLELYVNGAWTSVSDVLAETEVQVSRGYTDEGTIKPSTMNWAFLDQAGTYDPDNPYSPYYGLIGRNTQCRLSVNGNYDFQGEISKWTPETTENFSYNQTTGVATGRRIMRVEATGILRRIMDWTQTVESPLHNQIKGYSTLTGYWPIEGDESGSGGETFSNTVSGGKLGYATSGVTFGADDGLTGSDAVASLDATANYGGTFASTSTSGWQFSWAMSFTDVSLSATTYEIMRWRTTNGYSWSFAISNASFTYNVFDAGGNLLKTNTLVFAPQQAEYVIFRMKASVSGGTITFEPAYYFMGASVTSGVTDTFSGSLTRLASWSGTGAIGAGLKVGHVFGLAGTSDNLFSSDQIQAVNGFAGELTSARFARICTLAGIPYTVSTAGTAVMGPQRTDTVFNQLKECVDTEDGMLFDRRSAGPMIYFATNPTVRANSVAMALTYGTNVGTPFTKVIDGLDVANTVTVTQRDGPSATAQLTTGLLTASIIGEVKETVNVNVQDTSLLPSLAKYWLNRLSVLGARYPQVVIDIDANPSLDATATVRGPSDLITVTGYREETIYLMVIGVQTSTGTHRRKVTLLTVPYDVFRYGVYDTARMDAQALTTVASYGSSTTLIRTTCASDNFWSKNAVPYDIVISGERMTVVDASSPGGGGNDVGGFEAGVAGWTLTAGGTSTLTSSTAQKHSGQKSALITVASSPATVSMRSATGSYRQGVVAGGTYSLVFWVYCASVVNLGGAINWYDSSTAFISSGGVTATTNTAGVWTKVTTSVVAPALATQAMFGPSVTGSPANGTLVYFDDVELLDSSGTTQMLSVTRAVNGISKTLPSGSEAHVFNPGRYAK